MRNYILEVLVKDHLDKSREILDFTTLPCVDVGESINYLFYDIVRGMNLDNLVCSTDDALLTDRLHHIANCCNRCKIELEEREDAQIFPIFFSKASDSIRGLQEGRRVMLLKSVTKACHNTYNLITRLEASNIEVVGVVSLLDFDSYKGSEKLLKEGYYFNSIFTEKELLGKQSYNIFPMLPEGTIQRVDDYFYARREVDY